MRTKPARRQGSFGFVGPSAAFGTEQVLESYAKPLLASVGKLSGGANVAVTLASAERALRGALHARELQQRISARADALAADAERAAETALRLVHEALGARSAVAKRSFPGGLSAALVPRGIAQVEELERILVVLENAAPVPPKAVTRIARLSAATKGLAQRCATATQAHVELVELRAAEHRQQRAFRTCCHEAYGALLGMAPERANALARLFAGGSTPSLEVQGIPAAPTTSREKQKRNAKHKAKRGGRRSP
jgi:hypothetical protein